MFSEKPINPNRVENPCCPRCGYDQRGLITTWTDTCPVIGLCSECGYTFAWSDVMRPDRQRLPGFFEHTKGFWPTLRGAWRTLAWVIVPPVFWLKVKMHHEVCIRRALFWPVCAFSMMWFLIGTLRFLAYFTEGRHQVMPLRTVVIESLQSFVFPVLYVEPTTWTWVAGIATRVNKISVKFLVLDWSPAYLGVIGQGLLFPLLLLALPATRRQATIRKCHVLRAAIYGQGWLVLPLTLLLVSAFIGIITVDWDTALCWDGPVLDVLTAYRALFTLVLVGWIALWWWCALQFGFQMKHATRHWFVLMLAAVIVFFIFALSDWDMAIALFSCGA